MEFKKLNKGTKSHSVLFVFPLHLKNHTKQKAKRTGSLLGSVSTVQVLNLDLDSFGQGYCFPEKAPVFLEKFLREYFTNQSALHNNVIWKKNRTLAVFLFLISLIII